MGVSECAWLNYHCSLLLGNPKLRGPYLVTQVVKVFRRYTCIARVGEYIVVVRPWESVIQPCI